MVYAGKQDFADIDRNMQALINESEQLFENLQVVNRLLFSVANDFHTVYAADHSGDVAKLEQVTSLLMQMVGKLSEDMIYISHMRQVFSSDPNAPTPINQGFAIGYARIALRNFYRAWRSARALHVAVNVYIEAKHESPFRKIRRASPIYQSFIDTESYLSQGNFALRISYNHLVSQAITRQLLGNVLTTRDLKKGDIILSYKTPNYLKSHFLSRLISIAEHKNITHAAIVYSVEGGDARALAAVGDAGLVDVYTIKQLLGEYWFVFRPKLSGSQYDALCKVLDRWVDDVRLHPGLHRFAELKSWVAVGIGYLFSEIVLHANTIIMVPNLVHSTRDYFCSDVIDAIFKDIGIHLVLRSRNEGVIGPAEIFFSPYVEHTGVLFNEKEKSDLSREKWAI
jgi:hypothetical protein